MNHHQDALYEAVAKLIKAKGRFHTEQNYGALVAAFDAETAARRAPAPTSEPGARELLQEFVDYHSKPAGMTVDIALDVDQLGDFLAGVEAKEKAMVKRAVHLLATPASPVLITPEMLDEMNQLRTEKLSPASPAVPDDRDHLLRIIAFAYQIAGAHDAPEHILDVLADPESATTEQVDAMLPYQAVPSPAPVAPVNDDLLDLAHIALHSINVIAHAGLTKKTSGSEMRVLFKRIINESCAAMKETTLAASPLVDEAKQIVAGKVPGRGLKILDSRLCPTCDGKGSFYGEECDTCSGCGRVPNGSAQGAAE